MTTLANTPATLPDKNRQILIEFSAHVGIVQKVAFYAHKLDVEAGLFLNARDVEEDEHSGKDYLQEGFYQLYDNDGASIMKRGVISWEYKND